MVHTSPAPSFSPVRIPLFLRAGRTLLRLPPSPSPPRRTRSLQTVWGWRGSMWGMTRPWPPRSGQRCLTTLRVRGTATSPPGCRSYHAAGSSESTGPVRAPLPTSTWPDRPAPAAPRRPRPAPALFRLCFRTKGSPLPREETFHLALSPTPTLRGHPGASRSEGKRRGRHFKLIKGPRTFLSEESRNRRSGTQGRGRGGSGTRP